uniref:Uncharacterized protein n=1 Tax=Panagrolaimus sp. JU765 TaxID=591449 RepID=A0AC34Q929_9BILA
MSITSQIQEGLKKAILAEGSSYASAVTPKRSPSTPVKSGAESGFQSSVDQKLVQRLLSKNNYYKYAKSIRFWLCNYSIYLQADDSDEIKQVSLALDKQNLQRIVVKDEIVLHFDSNPEIFYGILNLIRIGPKCALKICARGYLDGLLEFMTTLRFTRCVLMDLKSESTLHLSEILNVLKDATHIELDLQGLRIDTDIGKMLKDWDRESTIVEIILHNLPRTIDISSLELFVLSKLVPAGKAIINWIDK